MALIEFTDKGLYCPPGDFYIDPWRPVERAVITHAHSDHARWGHQHYLCHQDSLPILQLRLGPQHYETLGWNEPVYRQGVRLSLHPAGHIIGSAQVRVEYRDEVWVVSGDYKTEHDGISTPFEPVRCHTFITESTFGLPIYRWKPQAVIYQEIQQWVMQNTARGKSSIITAYSLGKAQRILPCLSAVSSRILVHGAIWNTQEALQQAGWNLPAVERVTPDMTKEQLQGAVVVAPPSADGSPWIKKFAPFSIGICSGWMQVRGNQRRRNADAGFALSDHADWEGLLSAIKATGAQKVFVTHGFQSVLSRYLTEQGIEAAEVQTAYGNEEEDSNPAETDNNHE